MPWKYAQELNDDDEKDYGQMVVIAMVVGERLGTVVMLVVENGLGWVEYTYLVLAFRCVSIVQCCYKKSLPMPLFLL